MINFDLIQAGILIGSSPVSGDDIVELKRLKVTAVICLQSDEDLRERRVDWSAMNTLYESHALAVYRYPINDFDELDLAIGSASLTEKKKNSTNKTKKVKTIQILIDWEDKIKEYHGGTVTSYITMALQEKMRKDGIL